LTARTRVQRLVGFHGLEPAATDRLLALLELLGRDPAAPSSVRDPERAVEVHIADSLSALELPEVAQAGRVTDLGSGAGFPGLPLAIARPRAAFVLLESSRRKCEFLGRALAVTGAANARVVCARAESWAEGRDWAELVVARALGELALVCEYAAPLLALGGGLVAWKGSVSAAERSAGERAARELGLDPGAVVRTAPYPGSVSHHLHVYMKIADTPPRFPRRPGAAQKRPLGRDA